MKQLFSLGLLLLFLLVCSGLQAQERLVTGTVKSVEDETPLPGVNVILKGSSTGTITDVDGKFQVKVSSPDDILTFSFVGLVSKEMQVGNRSNLEVLMKSNTQQLQNVVVTALGFEEDADTRGIAYSNVEGKSLVRSGENTVINGLSGRAAGVQISRSSGDPGAGTYIQIRGQNTITGATQPLVIVDGIPVSNTTGSPTSDIGNSGENTGGVRQQSRLNDINPADIESIQVLKGASAAALWGSRAANGVILITTKQGNDDNKLDVSFRSTFSLDEVNVLHPLQNKFGQGQNGIYSPTASRSYGDRIADRPGGADVQITDPDDPNYAGFFETPDGTRYYAIPAGTEANPSGGKNSRDTFNDQREDQVFGLGYFTDNYLSISGGNEKSNIFMSIGHMYQDGVYEGPSDYSRTTIRLNAGREFNKVVSLKTRATYARTFSNRIQTGSNLNGLYLGMLRAAPDFDGSGYIGSYFASPNAAPVLNRHRSYRRYLGNATNPIYNNPLWTINEQENTTLVNRYIVSSELSIKPVNWFEFIARGGIDAYDDERKTLFPVHSAGSRQNGRYDEFVFKESQLNLDLIGKFNTAITPDILGTFLVGWNINDRNYNRLGYISENFLIPGGPGDASNAGPGSGLGSDTETFIRSVRNYASANFGIYDQVFLNVSGAFESSSAFGEDKTFFYPAADVAWQFTSLDGLSDNSILSFGKLRGGYGQVGVQPLPHRTSTDFVSAVFGSWGANLAGGNGIYPGAFVQSAQRGDPELKPEIKTEWEIGTDLRFFRDRLKTSFTYYENEINDILLEVALPPTVGFEEAYTNAGTMQNKGWELDLGYTLFSTNNFSMELFANANRNLNEVVSLGGSDEDVITLGGFSTLTSSVAKVGEPLSALFGGVYERTNDGSLDLDENGFPQVAAAFDVIGDPNPDWRGGFGTNVSYKGFSLNVLFETFQGADFAPNTRSVLYNFGKHADTGNEVNVPAGGLVNYAGETIEGGQLVRGNIRDFGGGPVLLDEAWYTTLGQGFSNLQEQFIVDGSWTRLREITLSYRIGGQRFREITKLANIELSATGRNLILWTDVVGIDPETSLDGATNARGQDYFNNPGTRSYVFSLKINY